MTMNNRLLVPQKLPLLLDYAPGAAAAYSLRALSNSYVGPVVTVRRSTDNAERDFTASEVNDGTLAAWCGGGDGFVKTWWSQTGSNHASQSTAGYQPKIVASGVVVTKDGKPAVQFDGTDDQLLTASTAWGSSLTAAIVFSATYNSRYMKAFSIGADLTVGGYAFLVFALQTFSDWVQYDSAFIGNGYGSSSYPRIISNGRIFSDAQQNVCFFSLGAAQSVASVNGGVIAYKVNQTGSTDTSSMPLYISGRNTPASQSLFGTISELIIYPTDMTALRTRIEGDLAWYY